MKATIASHGVLYYVPEPVTCFKEAEYHQSQTFTLDPLGSAVIVDWMTSGRMHFHQEAWQFKEYRSCTVLEWTNGTVFLKDDYKLASNRISPLSERTMGFHCFAMVYLMGPKTLDLQKEMIQRIHHGSDGIMGSCSPLAHDQGLVLKVGGKTTQLVRQFLSVLFDEPH